jgi:hypothetical protein
MQRKIAGRCRGGGQSRHLVDSVDDEFFRVRGPDLADVFVRHQTAEGLQAAGEGHLQNQVERDLRTQKDRYLQVARLRKLKSSDARNTLRYQLSSAEMTAH